jgi:hypothetical protein
LQQIVSVSRKKYAVGLFWQPLPTLRSASDVAKKIAAGAPNAKFKYYAQYRNLVGLGSPLLKHYAGLAALAPEVMETFGDSPSFVAAFKTGGGYWILAVRNGIILADQDRLFSDEEGARAAYLKLLALPDWSLKVAPDSWGITGSQERSLDEVIGGRAKSVLKPLNNSSMTIIKVLFFAAAAAAAMYFFEADINRLVSPKARSSGMTEESARLYREQLALMNSAPEQAPIEIPEEEEPVMPWQNIPDPAALASACTRAIAFVMQPIYGWNIISAECGDGSVRALARRDYGTVEDLHGVVGDIMPGINIKMTGGNDAELSGAFPPAVARNVPPEDGVSEIERRVRSAFQAAGMQADISRGKDIVPNPAGTVKRTAEFVMVRADSKIMPDEFVRLADDFSSREILSVRWDSAKSQWSYEEKIYAR